MEDGYIFFRPNTTYQATDALSLWFTRGALYRADDQGCIVDDDGDSWSSASSYHGLIEVTDDTPSDDTPSDEAPTDPAIKPSHYTRYVIEPITFIMRNGFEFWRGNIVKYASRAGHKMYDGMDAAQSEVTDLRKVIRYAEMRINQLNGEAEL